jgi:ATP-dependent protease ClpP protease subunit
MRLFPLSTHRSGFAIAGVVDSERLQRPLRRFLGAAALAGALLLQPSNGRGSALETGPHASTASTSRWWTLACGREHRAEALPPPGCVFTVRIRGTLDGSRLHLIQQALRRRDRVGRALHRDVAFQVDVDSQGGGVFAAMEIGRLLRSERASISVGEGASCISSCVFLLMGAVEGSVSDGARLGIHRPSLGASARAGQREGGREAIVDAMAEGVVLYAEQMNVPRRIVDEMMSIPSDRVKLLKASDLAEYGIFPIDLGARGL